MANDSRPVAIRIARPYSTEEAFLEHELETITRTSVTLIGAQSRPQGVILRFEVTLASGAPLLRGEGRVVGYKRNAIGDEPGLTLRFTRLDPRSKVLIDRAAAMREARARGRSAFPAPPPGPLSFQPAGTDEPTQIGPPPEVAEPSAIELAPVTAIPSQSAPPPYAPPPPTEAPRTAPSPPSQRPHNPPPEAPAPTTAYDRETLDRLRSQRALAAESAPKTAPSRVRPAPPSPAPPTAPQPPLPPPIAQSSRKPAPPLPASMPISPPPTSPAPTARQALAAPPARADLLDRLRDRARSLPAARVAEILSRRASRG